MNSATLQFHLIEVPPHPLPQNQIRVLQLTSSVGFYGLEQVMMTLIKSFDQQSFDVRVASLEKKRLTSSTIVSEALSAGIEAVTIPCRGRLDWKAVMRLKSMIEDQRIQILHCHEPKSRLYGALASRLTGIPIVATHHNWTRDSIRTTLVEYIDAACLHFCHKVIAVSRPVAESARRALVSRRRIEIIPNGIDLTAFTATSQNPGLRASLGIPPDVPVIGSVGRLDKTKGHELLIEAARRVVDAGQGVAILIVGEGVERDNLELLVQRLGLSDQVVFAGYQRDVKRFMTLMDVFVLPSRREGTPMALLEAMALGKPVVGTPVGGVPDILSNGLDGIVLPERSASALGDALLTLLQDPVLADRLARRGRLRVEAEFSASRMAERYEDLYRRCLSMPCPVAELVSS